MATGLHCSWRTQLDCSWILMTARWQLRDTGCCEGWDTPQDQERHCQPDNLKQSPETKHSNQSLSLWNLFLFNCLWMCNVDLPIQWTEEKLLNVYNSLQDKTLTMMVYQCLLFIKQVVNYSEQNRKSWPEGNLQFCLILFCSSVTKSSLSKVFYFPREKILDNTQIYQGQRRCKCLTTFAGNFVPLRKQEHITDFFCL